MTPFNFTACLIRNDEEVELDVSYTISTHYAATYYQPAEGGEIELISTSIPTTDAEDDLLIEQCAARAAEDGEDRAFSEADYWHEQRRDQQMTDDWERNHA